MTSGFPYNKYLGNKLGDCMPIILCKCIAPFLTPPYPKIDPSCATKSEHNL